MRYIEVHKVGENVDRASESEAHEREKLALRLENELLKFERGLPYSRQSEEAKEE